MSRCHRTTSLDVYHRNPEGGNGIDNAEVRCFQCHQATQQNIYAPVSSPPFSQATKDGALRRAGNRCECMRMGGCH